jgi:hypothetical protein
MCLRAPLFSALSSSLLDYVSTTTACVMKKARRYRGSLKVDTVVASRNVQTQQNGFKVSSRPSSRVDGFVL